MLLSLKEDRNGSEGVPSGVSPASRRVGQLGPQRGRGGSRPRNQRPDVLHGFGPSATRGSPISSGRCTPPPGASLPGGQSTRGRYRRWDRWATASITPSPSRSGAECRSSSQTANGAHPRRAGQRDLRVHRDLPQRRAAPFCARHAFPSRARSRTSTRDSGMTQETDSTQSGAGQTLRGSRGGSVSELRSTLGGALTTALLRHASRAASGGALFAPSGERRS